MQLPNLRHDCRDPEFNPFVGPYCFGDLDEAERDAFERHLLACDRCWREVDRMLAAVGALRTDGHLTRRVQDPEVIGVLGMSGRLDQPFAGHLAHALVVSTLFALLFAVPVFVEVAYQFDRHASTALRLALLAFLWMLGGTLAALWVDIAAVRRGAGIARGLFVMVAAAASLGLFVVPFLPDTPTVLASFGTWPAHLGYLKSVFYAFLVGPIFILWLFHFVVTIQYQLRAGRCREVLGLLTQDKAAVAPRGAGHPRLWMLTAYLVGLFVLNYFGVNHLFGALEPGPYKVLFMSLVLVRVTIWLALPTVCLWWFAACLNELKRECLVVQSFEPPRNGSGLAH